MQLAKHIAQGKLTYLSQGTNTLNNTSNNTLNDTLNDALNGALNDTSTNALSVSENEHYRWLAFACDNGEQVIQSIMLKRKPWALTLPHQTALMLPLLFFKPNSVVEFGLGGGNIQRFITNLSAEITIHSIEHNSAVIECFNKYFNPQANQVHVIYNDSKQWLQHNHTHYDWYVCDIYQQEIKSYNNTVSQLEHLTEHITPNTCLSINLPDANDHEVNLLLTILKQVSPHHEITYFHIPNYLNIIVHLIPKQWQTYKRLKRNSNSYLPKNIFSKWKGFWRHGKNISL